MVRVRRNVARENAFLYLLSSVMMVIWSTEMGVAKTAKLRRTSNVLAVMLTVLINVSI